MKVLKQLAGVFALLLSLSMSVIADEAKTGNAEKEAKAMKNQTHCPVMGGKIDSTVYTDIQGQRVYHCCPMCSGKLKADPDKYFKEAAANGVLFENIQTTCPVSGKDLEKKLVYTDYEGRRVYFCCEMCPDKFAADPAEFLKKMDAPAGEKPEPTKEMKQSDHSGHGH